MTQNQYKFCLSCFICQEPGIIWLSFMVHLCNMMIAPVVFFKFSKCSVSVLYGWKGKKWSKTRKNCVCCAPYLRNHTSYDCHLWYTCKTIITAGVFFPFFRILIFWVVRGDKGQKWQKWQKTLSVVPYISGTIHHMSHLISQEPYIWSSFMVHMCKRIISPGFLSAVPTSICHFFCLSVHPSVTHNNLRYRTSCVHNFWYTYVK